MDFGHYILIMDLGRRDQTLMGADCLRRLFRIDFFSLQVVIDAVNTFLHQLLVKHQAKQLLLVFLTNLKCLLRDFGRLECAFAL